MVEVEDGLVAITFPTVLTLWPLKALVYGFFYHTGIPYI